MLKDGDQLSRSPMPSRIASALWISDQRCTAREEIAPAKALFDGRVVTDCGREDIFETVKAETRVSSGRDLVDRRANLSKGATVTGC